MNKNLEIISKLLEKIELPESAYQKAVERYEDIGEWLSREDSISSKYSPKIFSQGSFRLGTAIRPLNQEDEYDLDLTCNFQSLTKEELSQSELKELIRRELESYRKARGIKSDLEEKHRCWRLDYMDTLSFHIDVIPCVPNDEYNQQNLYKSMISLHEDSQLSLSVSKLSVALTDDRHEKYSEVTSDWLISNPEGYATWFESRMALSQQYLLEKRAEIQEIPLYKRKSVLQRTIQLLKRHRDSIFIDSPDLKPSSIIITTLSAKAYQGETDITLAMKNIINTIEIYVNYYEPRIPNPVNPHEDFADCWKNDKELEKNFKIWIVQAKIDFGILENQDIEKTANLNEQLLRKFNVDLNLDKSPISSPTIHIIDNEPLRPWSK